MANAIIKLVNVNANLDGEMRTAQSRFALSSATTTDCASKVNVGVTKDSKETHVKNLCALTTVTTMASAIKENVIARGDIMAKTV